MEHFTEEPIKAAMLIKRRKVQPTDVILSIIKEEQPDYLHDIHHGNEVDSLLPRDSETGNGENSVEDEPDATADMGESAADGSGEKTVALIKEQIEDTKIQLETYFNLENNFWTSQICKAELKNVREKFDAKMEKLHRKRKRVMREIKNETDLQLKFVEEKREDLKALLEHKENTLKLKMEYQENKKRAAECKERLDRAQKEFDLEQKMRIELRNLRDIEQDTYSGKKIGKKLQK